jgi:hypothetical protein
MSIILGLASNRWLHISHTLTVTSPFQIIAAGLKSFERIYISEGPTRVVYLLVGWASSRAGCFTVSRNLRLGLRAFA